MGPIRMTSALIEHLKGKSDAVVAYTSSVLGFVPLAATAVYSSRSIPILLQRFMLRDTTVRVLEIAPPWVRTELMNSQEAEEAMPLEQFIEETIASDRRRRDPGRRGQAAPSQRRPKRTRPGQPLQCANDGNLRHRESFIRILTSVSPSHTQGGSRVRESRPHGSGRGAVSNDRPYRSLRRAFFSP
jgi:NAD(P)-dependent dehydrogenase (short-subunit alcohol dehydrogenase family)